MSSSRSWRVSGSDMRRSCICSAERRMSGSAIKRSDMAWKRVVMSFIDVSWATWMRIGWLAAATTASAWARTISMPLQPRHSPLSPQWHTWGRRRSRARWSSDMSVGPAIDPRLRWLLSLVHRVDLVGVPLGDDLPLDLEGGSDLARFLGEGAGQKREVFDSLPGANSLVDRVHGLVYQPDDAWVFDQL